MMGDNLLIQLKYPYIIDVQLYMFNWYLLSVNYWYISIFWNYHYLISTIDISTIFFYQSTIDISTSN